MGQTTASGVDPRYDLRLERAIDCPSSHRSNRAGRPLPLLHLRLPANARYGTRVLIHQAAHSSSYRSVHLDRNGQNTLGSETFPHRSYQITVLRHRLHRCVHLDGPMDNGCVALESRLA